MTQEPSSASAPAGAPSGTPPAAGAPPVTITEAAGKKVIALMAKEGLAPAEAGLRVSVIGGGCSGLSYKLSFEKQPKTRDKIYEMHGVRVFLDPKSALYLKGTEVDFVDSLSGTGFTFQNQSAKGTCGCGQSFSA
ncbi:MAG: iron-sulfur cluster assembly accessory protein [Bdellovibrionota bacterium]